MDAVIDFGYSTTTNAPGLSGTTFDVVDGTVYPAPPFDVILYLPGTQPLKATAERGRCTAVVGNTLTVTRDLGGTNQNVQAGWAVDNALTAELLTQITSAIPAPATTVTGPDAFGAAAVVGTGTEYARIDHDHGLPAAPADIPLSTVTTAGDLIVGTGASAVTRLPVGTAGQVLLGGATPTWGAAPAGALSYYSGSASAATSVPASTWTTVLTSPSVAAGYYLATLAVQWYPSAALSAAASLALNAVPGTFEGIATYDLVSGLNSNSRYSLTGVIYLSTSGTISLQMNVSVAGSTLTAGTTYTLLKIA